MDKKTKLSLVISSAAAIVLAGSVLAGGTYALFTSESETNIVVSSGKVELVATVDGSSIITYSGENLTGNPTDDADKIKKTDELGGTNGTFITGGTATIDSGTLKLDCMVPGDKVEFSIDITNNSNVDTKYCIVISCADEDTALFNELEFTIDGEEFDSTNYISPWTYLYANDEVDPIECSVMLPTDAGNEYMDKVCNVTYTVQAYQGNAKVEGPMYAKSVKTTNGAIKSGASELVLSGDFNANVNFNEIRPFGSAADVLDRAALHFDNAEYSAMAETITISGNGKVTSNQMAIWAHRNAKIIVESGTYDNTSGDNGVQLIYANNNSVITVTGGIFMSNLKGEIFNVSGTNPGKGGKIIIKGGLYNKPLKGYSGRETVTAWQSSDDYNSGTDRGIKIEDGYKAVEVTDYVEGETWYRVVPDSD